MADRSIRLGTIFTADISDFIAKTDVMISRLQSMNSAMSGVGKGVNFSKVVSGVTAVGGAVAATTQTLKQQQTQLGSLAKSWGGVISALRVLTRYGIASTIIKGVTTSFEAGREAIIDYDQALKNLQAVTQSTDAEVEKMGAEIKKVSSETRLNAQQIAEGMVLIGQAGFDATQSIQTIRAAADLSVGTLEDMALSTDLLTSAIFAFQTRALESSRVADIMANAINRSKLTLDKLRVAFNYVGATARDAGVSMEEAAASMAILANNGIRASTIGTGLRQVLSRLLSPNKRLREEFEELGISIEEMNPATQGFERVMKNLAQVLSKGKDGAIDMGKAYKLFGLYGAQTAAILSKSFLTGSFQNMLDKMYEVGSASAMAQKQMEGLQAKLENLAARLKLVAIAFGEAGVTDAVKMFVDVLRAAAKVLADFLSSGVGKALVSFAMWTSGMYVAFKTLKLGLTIIKSAATALGLLGTTMTTIGGVTTVAAAKLTWFGKLITGLGAMLRLAWVKLKELWVWMTGFGTATATTSAIVRVATFSFKNLLAALGLTSPWGIAAAAIMGVIIALKAYIETTDESLKKQSQITDEAKTNWEKLNTYRKALEDLADQQSKGADVSAKYESTLKRIRTDLPELASKFNDVKVSLADNITEIKKYEDLEFDEYINSLTKEIDLYQKSIKETAAKQGYLTLALEGIKGLGQGILDEFGKVADLVGGMFKKIADDFLNKLIKPPLIWIRDLHKWLGMPVPETLTNAIDSISNAMSNLHKKAEQAGMSSDAVKTKTEELTAKYVEFGRAMAQVNESMSTDDILNLVRGLGATETQVKAVETAVKELRTSVVNDLGKMVEAMGKLPDAMKAFYDSLDPGDKIKFVELKGTLDKQIAEYKKKATAIGVIEKDQQRDIAMIRAEGLAKFIQDTKKEELSVKDLALEKVRIIEDYYRKEEELSKQSVERRKKMAEEQAKSFESMGMSENAKKVIQQGVEFAAAEEQRLATLREATREASNKVLLEYEQDRQKAESKLYAENVKEFMRTLQQKKEEVRKQTEDLRKEAAKVGAKYDKARAEVNKKELTADQQFYEDKKEYSRLYHKAIAEDDKESFDAARELAVSLAKEVKDKNGRVIESAEMAKEKSLKMLKDLEIAENQMYQSMIRESERTEKSLESDLTALKGKLEDFSKTIDSNLKKKMEIDMTESVTKMEAMYKLTSDFAKKWEELKSKTITLTVITNEQGGGGGISVGAGGGGGDQEDNFYGDSEDLTNSMNSLKESFDDYRNNIANFENKDVLGERRGGYIDALKRRMGGAISSGWKKLARGWKIPGYGGGDKVKVLAEPGEWVIRKEAVSKYGSDLFEALNNMDVNLPEWLTSLKRQMGGAIKRSTGGPISSPSLAYASASRGGGAVTIGKLKMEIKPTYMSGDKSSARRFAVEVQKELDELQKRKGKR